LVFQIVGNILIQLALRKQPTSLEVAVLMIQFIVCIGAVIVLEWLQMMKEMYLGTFNKILLEFSL